MQHRAVSLVPFFLVLLPVLAFGQLGADGASTPLTDNNSLNASSGPAGRQANLNVALVGDRDILWDPSRVLENGSNVSTTGESVPNRVQIFPATEMVLVGPDGQASGQTTSTSGKKSSDEAPWDWASGVSVGLGYQHASGSPGIGGLNVGGGWRWKDQIEATADLDFGSVTSIIGGINSKTKRQNYLFGGRYYVAKALGKHNKFEPFGHLMYGWSHQSINTTAGIPVTQTITSAQTSWAWDFGGGVDYVLSKHWALRGRADWLKTHFDNSGQSNFKWVAGFWYSFSARPVLH